jgi:PAS domain S-box-containing protein
MTPAPIDQILKEKQKFEALFNFATIGIIIANSEGIITLVNRQAEEIFGYGARELYGQKVEILIPVNKRRNHELDRLHYTNNPQVRPMGAGLDLKASRKDGSSIPVEISLSYFHSEEGMSVIAFILDITARKESEAILLKQKAELEKITREVRQLNAGLEDEVERRTEALRETLKELEKSRSDLQVALARERELGELKSRFVTMASHEFKTPLSTILTSATLAGKYLKAEEQPFREKHLRKIEDTVLNLTNLLNEFLSLDKLEEGKIRARPSQFSLAEMVRDLVGEMQTLAGQKRIILFQPDGKSMVFLDRDLLRNILINLISNAVKFSSEGGRILIRSRNSPEGLEITVEDNGIGMSREDQEHLFERFFRGRNAENIQGTGLGLHIVQRYLHLLKGTIKIQSELNKGTIVSLHFPYL